jgi:hypothetical protein
LSSTARAVPERCGGLVWRRPRPCESHAHESYEPDRSYEPYEPSESYEPCELSESYDPNESHEPGGSGQCTVTTSCMRCSTWATNLALGINVVVVERRPHIAHNLALVTDICSDQ